ncbi:HDOD domain-containing protein [Thalassotalea sp. LPB0316]|uniref:EAL and HDOD domain-containing protein n=1 Tax=Thalassotalea sp. LPB0316 TaxID=2769490 RepID=UPI0018670B7A|nr:HDOD domain-containing protein [Thalassotalea sp. LPB0316]QOL24761.1 HDOD domain-containing protein [Thalassotalea sp. LPB0316]
MQLYLARQAILGRKQNLVAYELLFRDGPENSFPNIDPHVATSKLINRTHFNKGLSHISGGKRALINFSEVSLLKRLPLLLPKDEIIIEILEDVTPSDAVYQACVEMYRQGYVFALDDFVYRSEWRRFLQLVKVVKFDLMHTPLNTIGPIVNALRKKTKIKLLAEKVETQEVYQQAMAMGFHFFQGYFFTKPEMKTVHENETNQHLLVLILQEAIAKDLNHKRIQNLLEQDSALVYRLLCFVNSGGFPLKTRISSVKQAMAYLGDIQLRRLLSLFATAVLASEKTVELTKMCVVRAKYCEAVCSKVAPGQKESGFLTGMFSLLDAVLESPMEQVLERLPMSDDIEQVLLDTDDKLQTPIAMALRSIRHIEQGHWHFTELEAKKMNVSSEFLHRCYQDAVSWAENYQNV